MVKIININKHFLVFVKEINYFWILSHNDIYENSVIVQEVNNVLDTIFLF